MLKSTVRALTLIMALSFSTQAMAANEAADAQEQQPYFDEITEGKLQSAAVVAAIGMQEQADVLAKEILALGQEVGVRDGDSKGLVKALGEKLWFAYMECMKIEETLKQMENVHGNTDVFKGYEDIETSLNKIQKLNKEAKALVKK